METVDVYTERGDLVTCSDCGKVMLLPYGADKCPACKKEGCLVLSLIHISEPTRP
mgnify:CR=1 FL=1